jgi:hypothetical protein
VLCCILFFFAESKTLWPRDVASKKALEKETVQSYKEQGFSIWTGRRFFKTEN